MRVDGAAVIRTGVLVRSDRSGPSRTGHRRHDPAAPRHASRPFAILSQGPSIDVLRGVRHGLVVAVALAALYGASLVATALGHYATAEALLTPRMSVVVAGGVLVARLMASVLRRR